MQLRCDHWSRGFMRFLIGILSEKRKAMQNQCLTGKVIFHFILPKDLASDLLYIWLVVSTQLKNISQIGSFPNFRGENKTYLKPPPSCISVSLIIN